jgi:hypothetical protein
MTSTSILCAEHREARLRYLFLKNPLVRKCFSKKRNWAFGFGETFRVVLESVPNFVNQTTTLHLGKDIHEHEFTGEEFARLPVFPNVTDFEIHFTWDWAGAVDLGLIKRLFPKLERLGISNPVEDPEGSLEGLYGLRELLLDNWCHAPKDMIIPYSSASKLTTLDLVDCFEFAFDEPDDESQILRFHRFSNLKHLRINPVYPGVEILLNTDAFTLETLQLSISTRNPNFDQILVPRPSLRQLRSLELKVFVDDDLFSYRLDIPTRLRILISQVSQLSSLVHLVLDTPFQHTLPPYLRSLSILTRLKWRVKSICSEHEPRSYRTAPSLSQLVAVRRELEKIEFVRQPLIVVCVETRYLSAYEGDQSGKDW